MDAGPGPGLEWAAAVSLPSTDTDSSMTGTSAGVRATDLPPYVASSYQCDDQALSGVSDPIRLSLSENPYGCSPLAREAARAELGRLDRYPDSSCLALRAGLAAHHGVAEDEVLVGNGIDELLSMVAAQWLRGDGAGVCCNLTYFGHAAAVLAAGGTLRRAAMGPDGALDPQAIAELMAGARIAVVCNPHNPFGTALDSDGVQWLIDDANRTGCLLVLDEAYAEFASADRWSSGLRRLDEADVVVLRTFSKAYGLAGLRCGYAIARPELLTRLSVARHVTPFSVNRVALAAARAALGDSAFLDEVVAGTRSTRGRIRCALRAAGHEVSNSQANFLLVTTRQPAEMVADRLLREHGVHARPCESLGLPRGLRLGMCRPEHEDGLIAALIDALGERRG